MKHGSGVSANTKTGRVMIRVRQKENLSQHSVIIQTSRVWQWAAYLIAVHFVNKFHGARKKKPSEHVEAQFHCNSSQSTYHFFHEDEF